MTGVAVLILSMTFIVDQTLNLHTTHVGGAQGFILSVNGISVIALFFLWGIMYRLKQTDRFQLYPAESWPLFGLILLSILSMRNAQHIHFSIYELTELSKMILIFMMISNLVRFKKTEP